MTAAVAYTGLAIAAADTRYTLRARGRKPLHADYGGKLVPLGSVSLATLGDCCYNQVAAERLIAEGAATIEDVLASLARTVLMADAEIARRWPMCSPRSPDRRSYWSAASNGTAYHFSPAGVLTQSGRDVVLVVGPSDGALTDEDEQLGAMLGRGRSQYDAIRATALTFANVADKSPLVSPIVEMSVGP